MKINLTKKHKVFLFVGALIIVQITRNVFIGILAGVLLALFLGNKNRTPKDSENKDRKTKTDSEKLENVNFFYKKTKALVNDFVAFDIETTGLSCEEDKIIQLSAVKYKDGLEVERFDEYINPNIKISHRITQINGITNSMLKGKPTIDEVLPKFLEFIGENVLVAHNASFDMKFILHNIYNYNLQKDSDYIIANQVVDTLQLSRDHLCDEVHNHKLITLKKYFDIETERDHCGIDDAYACAQIYLSLREVKEQNAAYELNKSAMILEKDGNIDGAIKLYEECINRNFDGNHPYDRLAILYRKLNRLEDEKRVLEHAIYVFENVVYKSRGDRISKLEKFTYRLDKLKSKIEKQTT